MTNNGGGTIQVAVSWASAGPATLPLRGDGTDTPENGHQEVVQLAQYRHPPAFCCSFLKGKKCT